MAHEQNNKQDSIHLKVKRLELVNFRCYNQIEISFHDNLTALIGFNGAGKTALMEGLSGLLQPLAQRLTNQLPPYKIEGFGESDVKNGTAQAINTVWVALKGQQEEGDVSLNWYATLDSSGYEQEDISEFDDFNRLDTALRSLRLLYGERKPVSFPVLAYYPCTYAAMPLGANGMEQKTAQSGLPDAYDNALNGQNFDLNAFNDWLVWQINLAEETKDDHLVRAVSDALLYLLSDENSRYDALRSTYKGRRRNGEIMLNKNGQEVRASQLSSGERTLFGLVGDLARRLVMANPYQETPLHGSGIVLIDEIDLHLHPSWQRMVITKLREIFPNVQFIMTTHSPLVLQGVQRENIRVLIDGKISEEVPFVYGRDPNSITEDAFGVALRPHDVEKMVEEISRLIDEENEGAAKEKLNELKKLWGDDDREIQRLALHTELM